MVNTRKGKYKWETKSKVRVIALSQQKWTNSGKKESHCLQPIFAE